MLIGLRSGLSQILNKPASFYTLPQASTTVLGGVRIDGTSITMASNGQISAVLVDIHYLLQLMEL
ncbi:MAG: hypothetical protein CM15mV4_1200 [Caudoviricetes sp.]|nr:MAG: hypothetical protein CM15mV4_1200 [Caudoviricetes sp.]